MRSVALTILGVLLAAHLHGQRNRPDVTYKGHLQVGYGYDNNIFRSPLEYRPPNTPPDSLRDPRQNDQFLYLSTRHRIQGFVHPKHRLALILDGKTQNFSTYGEYSEYDLEGKLKYRFKPWKIAGFFGGTGVRRAHKRLFNVLGQGLARLFTFTDVSLAHWQRWRPVRFIVFTPEIAFTHRNYVEIPNRMSLDNRRLALDAKLQVIPDRKGYHQFFFRPYAQFRNYRAWIVRDSLGNRLPTYPLRKYQYKGVEGGYQLDMEPLTITLAWYTEQRRDNFQQWYGYNEMGYRLAVAFDNDRWRAGLTASYRDRDWLQKKGYLVDKTKPPLFWQRLNVSGEVSFFPLKWGAVYCHVAYLSRETNVEVPFKKVNRPYESVVVHGGIALRIDTDKRKR